MTATMTIEQILSAALSDINRQIRNGRFKGDQDTTDDNEENFYTIESLYAQWAENPAEASLKLWETFEEDYPDWIKDQ